MRQRGRFPKLAFAVASGLLLACAPDSEREVEETAEPQREDATAIDAEQREQLRALGYVDVGTPLDADARVGVLTHDAARTQPGLNVYTEAKSCATKIMTLQGEVVHTWSHEPCFRWENTVLLPDGDLLVPGRRERGRDPESAAASRYLMRLAWDGERRWTTKLPVHHDVERTPRGRLLSLTHRFARIPAVHPWIPVRDHRIVLLSAQGELLDAISLWQLIAASPDVLPLSPLPPRRFEGGDEIDLFHSNSVEWMRHAELVGRDPIYGESTVLVCIRNQDAIAILDWETRTLLWAWGPGELSGPHDATWLASGNILIFDNGLGRDWSRVVELDPIAREIVWEYRAPEPRSFYSRTRGASQRLANGNTLVTESDSGRAFEVTANGDVVWEWRNPDLSEKREPGVVVRMRRLEGIGADGLSKRLASGGGLPRTD